MIRQQQHLYHQEDNDKAERVFRDEPIGETTAQELVLASDEEEDENWDSTDANANYSDENSGGIFRADIRRRNKLAGLWRCGYNGNNGSLWSWENFGDDEEAQSDGLFRVRDRDPEHGIIESTPQRDCLRFWFWRTRAFGLACCLVFVLVLVAILVAVIDVAPENIATQKDSESSLPLEPFPSPRPTISETPVAILVPAPTPSPSSQPPPMESASPELVLPASVDGYVLIGELILKDVEVRQTPYLLVETGPGRTTSLARIAFDASSIPQECAAATVVLRVLDAPRTTGVLYAKAYPSTLQNGTTRANTTTPQQDIDAYASRQLGFDSDDDWRPVAVSPDSAEIQVDALGALRAAGSARVVEVLLAWDNRSPPPDSTTAMGRRLTLYGSESPTEWKRPQLLVAVEEPSAGTVSQGAATRSPSPSASAFPTVLLGAANETRSPAPTPIAVYPACDVCAGSVLDEDHQPGPILNLEGFGERTTCGKLEADGRAGAFTPATCGDLQQAVPGICCRSPSVFVCDLCGDGRPVVDPSVPLAESQPETCGEYLAQAEAGEIDPSFCSILQPLARIGCCGFLEI